jgi:catechol 2,3-dioxygenase-like lactoylglutathione lyase family enzyme
MVMKLSSPGIDLGIVVSDLDRSLHFYRGLLGLHHEGSNPVPGGGTMHRLWAAESMIKLVAPESPPEQPVIPGGLRAGALGLR